MRPPGDSPRVTAPALIPRDQRGIRHTSVCYQYLSTLSCCRRAAMSPTGWCSRHSLPEQNKLVFFFEKGATLQAFPLSQFQITCLARGCSSGGARQKDKLTIILLKRPQRKTNQWGVGFMNEFTKNLFFQSFSTWFLYYPPSRLALKN